MTATVKSIMNFIRGRENRYHFVSYHVDPETDKVIIDWCGWYAGAKENSFVAWNGSVRFPERNELETALNEYIRTHEVKEYTLDMAYQRMREQNNIK